MRLQSYTDSEGQNIPLRKYVHNCRDRILETTRGRSGFAHFCAPFPNIQISIYGGSFIKRKHCYSFINSSAFNTNMQSRGHVRTNTETVHSLNVKKIKLMITDRTTNLKDGNLAFIATVKEQAVKKYITD